MKNYYFFLFWTFLLPLKHSFAKDHIASAEVISAEQNLSEVIHLEIKITSNVPSRFTGTPEFSVPAGWKVLNTNPLAKKQLNRKENIIYRAQIKIDRKNLHFYPQMFSVTFPMETVVQGNTAPVQEGILAQGRIYFTPYNTVEIFSEGDFHNAFRVWINESPEIDASRRFIPRSEIPVSDLNMATDTIGGKDMDDIMMKLVYVPGLAYLVPMKITSDSLLIEDFDDGIDSLGAENEQYIDELTQMFIDASNNYNKQNLENLIGKDNLKNAKVKFNLPKIHVHIILPIPPVPVITKTFKGTITGRLTSRITNDVGIERQIGMGGIFVALKDKDKVLDQLLAYTHTDLNGNFTLRYEVTQTILEGENLEIYLQFKSKSEEFDIKAKQRTVLGPAYQFTVDLGQTKGGNIHRDVETTSGAFRATSWAYKAWRFNKEQGDPLTKDLTILPFGDESYFMADGAFGVSNKGTSPFIKIASSDCNQEATMYHEFGHFVMWQFQGFNYIHVIQKSDEHSWHEENTSRLAWSEGWADAHSMILDAFYWEEDQEYGYELPTSRAYGAYYENRTREWQANVVTGNTRGLINNGINSEYFVACAIYDLWDGQGKGIPVSFPAAFGLGVTGGRATVGFADNGTWLRPDDVELDYKTIIRPLRDGGGGNKVQNIFEYFARISGYSNDCNFKSNVARAFYENRVVLDITEFERTPGVGVMIPDRTFSMEHRSFSGKTILNINASYSETYYITYLPSGQNTTIESRPMTNTQIINYIEIGRLPTIGVNINMNSSRLAVGFPVNPEFLTYSTCNRSGLRLVRGTVNLGGTTGYRANLEVNNQGIVRIDAGGIFNVNQGSELIIRSGGMLLIRTGSTLNLTGKITIENGAFICIENGANLNFANGSELFIAPNAIVGTNPVWNIGNTVCTTTLTSCVNLTGGNPNFSVLAEALWFDGQNDHLEIPETNGRLNLGTGNFTFEAIFKSDAINSHRGIQMLASKRNEWSSEGREVDGFMWGLWRTGGLYVQLGGTPNIGWDVGPNFLDGNCHHVAVTRNGPEITFYADGEAYYTYQMSPRNINSEGTFRIGRNHLSDVPFFGLIGEIRIWNVARTDQQVKNFMNVNLAPQTGLVGYWDMNEPSNSQTVTDLSTSNVALRNNGTLGNSSSQDAQDPRFVPACQLTCTVGGNFRVVSENGQYIENPLYENLELVAYPNPFNEETRFLIRADNLEGSVLKIVNFNGNEVYYQEALEPNREYILAKELPQGMYFVQLINASGIKTLKLIKN